jgi:hypothetical protein
MSDYFIYGLAAGPGTGGLPSLTRLPKHPADCFNKCEVALLPHGDDFTVAALSARAGNEFDLHLFRSEDWSWDTEPVVLADKNACSLLSQHLTSTVITIGGERGTVGWVDLWHGILLCDLLAENRNLISVTCHCRKPMTIKAVLGLTGTSPSSGVPSWWLT